jgi:hypothetical protein
VTDEEVAWCREITTNYFILKKRNEEQGIMITDLKELNKEYKRQAEKTWWDRYKGYVCFVLGVLFTGGVVSIVK